MGTRAALAVSLAAVLAECAIGFGASPPPAATRLDPGSRVEGRLGCDEQAIYEVWLPRGHFAHVLVGQRGVDVIVSVLDPQRKVLAERDSLTGAFGVESVHFLAQAAGPYRVVLRVLDPRAVRDRYWIQVDARPAGPQDRRILDAQRAAIEGSRLRSANDAASVPRATASLERARSLWRALGDREEEALAMYELGAVARGRGDNRLAIERFTVGVGLAREAGDRQLEARLTDGIGLTSLFVGDAAGAATVLPRAMTMAHDVEDVQTENEARNSLGWAESLLGHYQRAIEIYREAIAAARARSDRLGEAWPSNGLALAYLRIGERRKALATYERALDLFRSLGDRRGELLALDDVGFVYWSAGDAERAL